MNIKLVTEIIGYLAAIFGTILMLPQVYKTIKTRQVKDLSTSMIVIYIINCSLWEIYGILLHSLPMIYCNSAALIIGIFQCTLKYKFRKIK